MRKVKVAAAFLCLLGSGMIGGVTYDGNQMSVARADQSNQILEITAETVTTAASIETTAIVTTTTEFVTTKKAKDVTTTTTAISDVTTATSAAEQTTSSETETTAPETEPQTETGTTEKAAPVLATAVTAPVLSAAISAPVMTGLAATAPAATAAPESVTRTAAVTAATSAATTATTTEAQTETEPEVTSDTSAYAVTITEREYIMLCNVVGHEYGSDFVPVEEKALVAEVIMNRVNSPLFPNTVYDVLMQENQFTGLEYLVEMETMSAYVTQSVRDAVDLYLTHPEDFQHGYLFFNGDGTRNYFRTSL